MFKFTKMHGTGNDYIYINAIEDESVIEKIKSKIPDISNRHFGIGSDGVIFICKSQIADFKMRMFNSDGSEAEMCGNGIRCVGKFIYDNELLYEVIKEWDEAFSLDGNLCDNPIKTKQLILQRARTKGR